MRSKTNSSTHFSAVFWKRLWTFTTLLTAIIILTMPAIGANDVANLDEFIGKLNRKPADQLVVTNPSAGFLVLDQFDSHAWADAGVSNTRVGTYALDPKRRTEGDGALKVTAPVQPLVEENPDLNQVIFAPVKALAQAEDWSDVQFVTLDVYLEEHPADFPELELTLINSEGERFTTRSLINQGGTINRWENDHVTFPIQVVDRAAPAEILNDVRGIEIGIVGYNEPLPLSDSEAEAGLALNALTLHFDNFRLNGSTLWDRFEDPAFGWKAAGDAGVLAGLTHNRTWNDSAGALYLGWQYSGSNPEAIVSTSQIPQTIDWAPYSFFQAQIWVDNPEIPFTVRLTDEAGNQVTTPRSFSSLSRTWTAVTWPIPKQADIDFNTISQIEILVDDISVWQVGESYIDELILVRDEGQPYDVRTRVLAGKNEIEWTNPGKADIASVAVFGDTNGHPLSVGSGTQICQVSATAATSRCVHEGVSPGETWFYSVFPLQEGAVLPTSEMGQYAASQNQILIRPEGSQVELAISPQNGAILFVRDTTTGKNHSTGSLSQALWNIVFFDEATLPSLSAAEFSPESETARFSYTAAPPTLTYTWVEGAQSLTVDVAILPDGPNSFALKTKIDNQTGLPIRTVSMPHELGFNQTGLRHALLPLSEGITLLPNFFTEQRRTTFTRPTLFADLLAVESDSGNLALSMVQDSLYQAELIPNHNLSEPVFQPNRLTYGSTKNDGYMQVDMLTFIPSGQTWESGTLKITINQSFKEIARQYAADNRIDQNRTLAEKLAPWGNYEALSQSPIYFLDASKAIEWEKAAPGLLWQSVADEWLPTLGSPGLVQFYHWQQSAGPSSGLPGSQPIWTDKYGPEADLISLLDQLEQNRFLTMPSTNWTVWSDPTLRATAAPSATLSSLRGFDFPYQSGTDGVIVAPWRPELQAANDGYFETYSSQLPQSFMFAASGAGQGVRYTRIEDGSAPSVAAYTTAALAETKRLSQQLPIFSDTATDQMAQTAVGFNQSIHSQRKDGTLLHMGDFFETYTAYPFAAEMVHTQVAFYPHATRTDSWGAEDRATFTHYMLHGYNLTGEVSRHYDENNWLETVATYQKAVGQRTFGQPLESFELLTDDQSIVQTVWGMGNDEISIVANFDPENTGKTYDASGRYTISPNGFHAMSLDGDLTAGIYSNSFNGTPLTAGDHWLVVERNPRKISIKQLDGGSTTLGISRPRSWRDPAKINLLQIMSNGTARIVQLDEISPDKLFFTYNQNLSILDTTEYLLIYTDPEQIKLDPITIMSNEEVENLITRVNSWRSDLDNPLEWRFSTITLQTGSSNSMILRENNPEESFGKIESDPVEFDFGFDIEARLGATIIPPGATVTVALLDEETGESIQLLTADSEGTITGRVADVAEWNGSRTVRIQIWVSGEDTPVSIDFVELYPLTVSVNDPVLEMIEEEVVEPVEDVEEQPSGEPESDSGGDSTTETVDEAVSGETDNSEEVTAPVDDSESAGGLPSGPELPTTDTEIIWQEAFGPMERIWIPSGVKIETTSAGALVISENAPDQGFGRIEGETISVNLLEYPLLRLEVLEVAPGTGFTIQIQEQGNAYDFFDAIQTDQTGEYEINLVDLTGWNDDVRHDFRILIWVSGEGGSITVDNLSIGR